MHACPCCGYKTLPGRGDYDLCPVCWWEDEGLEPWEHSGPNHQTLYEARQGFLADNRPYRQREGKVRPPKRREARDPDWKPLDLTDEQVARALRATEEEHRRWEEEDRRYAQEVADDPEGPFKEYNEKLGLLAARASSMPHRQLKQDLRELNHEHGPGFPDAFVELQARLLQDEDYYRRHPFRAAWWVVRSREFGPIRHRWQIVRTGTINFAG